MKNILFIFGTRPEVIKLAPVILEFRKHPEQYSVTVCNTEQQRELSHQTLGYFGLEADINLDCMRHDQTLAEVQTRILSALSGVFKDTCFDYTFVQGDTMSVHCGALVSFYNKVPVCHVEAGLRSYDLFEPFPEEAMRQMTSRIADIHFAPTEANREALLREGISPGRIHVVGNTVIDALNCLDNATIDASRRFFGQRGIALNDKLVLVTAHRRENHGERLDAIISAIRTLATRHEGHSFIIPVHPNPNVREKIYAALSGYRNIWLLPPLDYPDLVCLMRNAKLILTDSGGIQEEAPTFGCPTLVMRYETERQEGIEAGVSILVGADREKIISLGEQVLSRPFEATRIKTRNPYGDGRSAQRIYEIIHRAGTSEEDLVPQV